jgi:excinuclease ABC subunit B
MYSNLTQFLHPDGTQNIPFLDHLFGKVDNHIADGGRVLLLTLTKKSSEEITNFLVSRGYKAYYLHSEIATMDRREIIKKLRTGQIDILV